MKKITTAFFATIMILSLLLSGCKTNTTDDTEATNTDVTDTDTINADASNDAEETKTTEQGNYDNEPALVLAEDQFNGVFSPFFHTTAMDHDIVRMVNANLIGLDRSAQPDDSGLAYYETPEEIKGEDGSVEKTIYTFKLKEGLVFSDGTPITADDVIFNYLVYCDPTYTGAETIYTTPIMGVNEYRYDDVNYASIVEEIKNAADTYEPTDAEIDAKAEELATAYADYGVVKEDLLPGGTYYEDETLTAIREDKYKNDESAYISKNLSDGTIDVPDIEGIKKINDFTVQVTIQGVDPTAIYNLGHMEVTPMAYYGEGFTKGDLSMVSAKNSEPMGAGPYRFKSYENNIVTLVANDLYYEGSPKIKKIKYQVSSTTNKLEGVKLGEFDISDPTASPDMVKDVEAIDNIHYELIDNLGYGYIGINAEKITDKNVRKGIMHLLDRKPAIQSYYGNLASIIERPISRVSWAYPKDATEVYGFDPAKAAEYFEKAGYVLEDGKLMKDGKQLSIEISIPADGTGDHPDYAIILGAKTEGEKLGMKVNIVDYADGNKFFDDLDQGLLEMWCAAWQATEDPDMYQVYASDGPSNHYGIKDEELDKLIMEARNTCDIEIRKKLYSQALDIIMDWAVEMPVYQRKNMYIFNKDVINIDTLSKDMTPFYLYYDEMENLELVQ